MPQSAAGRRQAAPGRREGECAQARGAYAGARGRDGRRAVAGVGHVVAAAARGAGRGVSGSHAAQRGRAARARGRARRRAVGHRSGAQPAAVLRAQVPARAGRDSRAVRRARHGEARRGHHRLQGVPDDEPGRGCGHGRRAAAARGARAGDEPGLQRADPDLGRRGGVPPEELPRQRVPRPLGLPRRQRRAQQREDHARGRA